MKRPQGFDQPPAGSSTAPADREATTAPIPVAPEPSRVEPVSRESGNSESPDQAGPWWTRPRPETSEPTPAAHAPERDEKSRKAAATEIAERSTAAKPAEPKSPFGRLPSNREINRAVRAARKERNRVERGEVRRFTKRSRRRRMIWLAALGTLVLLVAAVAVTAFSPLMALRTIDVAGTSRIDAAAVKKALDGQLGRPLPLVDQGAIRADLAAFPLIRSYSVESHPPNTIVVRIVERQPIGVIAVGSKFAVVDAAKVTIQTSDQRPDGYPVIKASGSAEDTDATSGFAAAASVLSALPPALLAQVDTITAATRDDVSFTLRGSGATVGWGSADDSALKAAALDALLKSVPDAGRYDVSSPHSVTTG
jgi:cell division protein FtsQ